MARNTQAQLTEALKRLMDRKSLDSITIQELADEANVNKKTFYYHYHGMPDILGWMYFAQFYQLFDAEGVTAENWMAHLRKISAEIRREQKHITAIYASSYAPEFRNAVFRMFDRAVEKYVRSSMDTWQKQNGRPLALSDTQISYLTSYHSMALVGMMEHWFRRGMKESDEEFSSLIHVLSNDSLFNAFTLMNAIK